MHDEGQNLNEPQPESAAAAPTARGESPQRQTVWPTVLGVVAIAWAGLNLLGGVLTVAMWFAMPEEFPEGSAPWYFSSVVLSTLLEIMVLIGGVWLIQRRQRGVTTCLIWAIIMVLWTPLSVGIGIYTGGYAELEAEMGEWAMIGAIVGGVVMALLMLILPVFLLIWFLRPAVKAEVAAWRAA